MENNNLFWKYTMRRETMAGTASMFSFLEEMRLASNSTNDTMEKIDKYWKYGQYFFLSENF